MLRHLLIYLFFFFNDPAPTEISPLPLHAALPISRQIQQPPLTLVVHACGWIEVQNWHTAGTERGSLIGAREKSRPPISDRKSTRLNSSHLVISYAVFCLKKTKSTRNLRSLATHAV